MSQQTLQTPSYHMTSVSVDWVAHMIYLTDHTNKAIYVCDYQCERGRTVVSSGLQQPTHLAVDPVAG